MDPNQFSSLAVIISVVVALTSIVAPILTTLLNNHHKEKLRLLELSDKVNREHSDFVARIFENYLRNTSRLLKDYNATNLQEYGLVYGSILLYLTDKEINLVNQCDDEINVENFAIAESFFRDIAEALRERIRTSSNEVK